MAARRLTLVFPGQGCQRVGMMSELLANWPQLVGRVVQEANESLGMDLGRLMQEGSQRQLTTTRFAQPAILTHSIALLRILEKEKGFVVTAESCNFVAGHSLGEYSALVAARALSFADAVKLVHYRGTEMERAVANADKTAMAALMPISPEIAEEICREASKSIGGVCQVANYNSPKQIVISGHQNAVEHAIKLAKQRQRVRSKLLEVSAPFHCELMRNAAVQLRQHLADFHFELPLEVPIVWNVEARTLPLSDTDQIRELLVQQAVSSVRWSQSVAFCLQNGATEFVEVGYGGILTGLLRQQDPKVKCSNLGSLEQLKSFLA